MTPVFMYSCSGEEGSTDESGESTEQGSETEEEAAPMSVQDIIDMIDEKGADALGEEVTVTAYAWGTSNMVDGRKVMGIGDEPLEGFKQMKVALLFNEDEDVPFEKDEQITFTGKIRETAPEIRIGDIE